VGKCFAFVATGLHRATKQEIQLSTKRNVLALACFQLMSWNNISKFSDALHQCFDLYSVLRNCSVSSATGLHQLWLRGWRQRSVHIW